MFNDIKWYLRECIFSFVGTNCTDESVTYQLGEKQTDSDCPRSFDNICTPNGLVPVASDSGSHFHLSSFIKPIKPITHIKPITPITAIKPITPITPIMLSGGTYEYHY